MRHTHTVPCIWKRSAISLRQGCWYSAARRHLMITANSLCHSVCGLSSLHAKPLNHNSWLMSLTAVHACCTPCLLYLSISTEPGVLMTS